jgi:hypothetical protein
VAAAGDAAAAGLAAGFVTGAALAAADAEGLAAAAGEALVAGAVVAAGLAAAVVGAAGAVVAVGGALGEHATTEHVTRHTPNLNRGDHPNRLGATDPKSGRPLIDWSVCSYFRLNSSSSQVRLGATSAPVDVSHCVCHPSLGTA